VCGGGGAYCGGEKETQDIDEMSQENIESAHRYSHDSDIKSEHKFHRCSVAGGRIITGHSEKVSGCTIQKRSGEWT